MKKIKILVSILFIAIALVVVVLKSMNTTTIAFINFQDGQLAELHKANDLDLMNFITYDKEDELSGIESADVIYTFHISALNETQNEQIKKALENGAKIFMFSSTSAENNLSNLNEEEEKLVQAYFSNGGLKNLNNLLRYSQTVLANNTLFSEKNEEPIVYPKDVFYRIGNKTYFEKIEDYWNYYNSEKFYKKNGKKIAIVNTSADPQTAFRSYQDSLILQLERTGNNVVALAGFTKRLDMLQELKPDIVLFFAHGRLSFRKSDEAVEWLKEQNIPLLNPQLVYQNYEDWMNDQQGASGAMMGQNLVVPELDGAIYPFALAAKYKNEQGYYTYKEIPGKVEKFVKVVNNFLRLKDIPNKDKKICIYYYKGAGQNAMVAENLEVGSSLLSLLDHLKAEGFNTGKHPTSEKDLLDRIQKEGPVYGDYAQGSFAEYVKNGGPDLISAKEYKDWLSTEVNDSSVAQVEKLYGPAPGSYFKYVSDDSTYVAVPRVQFGNIVLLPVLPSALGESDYAMIHGVKKAPPHAYIASYLWSRMKFKADAIGHFGTHGNLEFTPWKQVSLSENDWPEILTAPLPHFYIYSINNIGEAMMAKRRTYANLISHLTSALDESQLYGDLELLQKNISKLEETADERFAEEYKIKVRILLDSTNVAKDLELTKEEVQTLDREVVKRIDHYLFHLSSEKIDIGLHTFGKAFTTNEVQTTAEIMAIDPLANSLEEVDSKYHPENHIEDKRLRKKTYHDKAMVMVKAILGGKEALTFMPNHQQMAWKILKEKQEGLSKNKKMRYDSKTHTMVPVDTSKQEDAPTAKQLEVYKVLDMFRTNLLAVTKNRDNLLASFDNELNAYVNALSGGFTAPSSGGDPGVNPNAVPTGKNLYSINAESTPTKAAWNVGKNLGDLLLQKHISKHGDYPKKVAFTLWSSEFIRNEGLNIAQALYLLGVEPVWNASGRVHDVKLIPLKELKRPRIDVIVQTSGQLRDIAASRLSLINKAVLLAANDDEELYANHVKQGSIDAQIAMKEKGLSPKEAQEFAYKRVFGGVNGNYGTAIMGLVEKGDAWEDDKTISDQYVKNMGALYDDDYWSVYKAGVFEAMMTNTEVIVHPRSSNVTGPISLDHVYEFMGGLTLAVRNVTGKDPDGYFNDYRNKYNPNVQTLKEGIWAETRTHLFNPKYIKEKLKEGPSAAEGFAENFRDTYGWNVMKPDAIDKEIWEGYYDIYVKDNLKLGTVDFFKEKNPFALQEMTAVMLETIRKGYWEPSEEVTKDIVELHAELINDFKAGCSGFVCDNAKLKDMIENKLSGELKAGYQKEIKEVRNTSSEEKNNEEGLVLKKEELTLDKTKELLKNNKTAIISLLAVIALFGGTLVYGIYKRRR